MVFTRRDILNLQLIREERGSLINPRWLLIALACIGVHQIQSAIEEPGELPSRLTILAIIALTPLSLRLPPHARGWLWLALGLFPTVGSLTVHLLPIIRDQRVPPASETAPLNLAGGVFLCILGAASLSQRDRQ